MADHPLNLKDFEVRAILEGRKTQKRLLLHPYKPMPSARINKVPAGVFIPHDSRGPAATCFLPPSIKVGDRLWVREKAAVRHTSWHHKDGHSHLVSYAADENECGQYIATVSCGNGIRKGEAPSIFPRRSHRLDGRLQWQPSSAMPRWASRLTLLVTGVQVQRLQDITRDDAMDEGIVQTWGDFFGNPPKWAVDSIEKYGSASGSHIYDNHTSVENYRDLWDHINGPGSWAENPWVVVYVFSPVLANIDAQTEVSHG